MNLRVLEDAEAVAAAAAGLLAAATGHVILSGGSTPKRAYALAAGLREDWSGVTLWLGDERHVGAADERSNARMVRAELLGKIPRAGLPRFEPVDTELDLDAAAADYDRRLRAALERDGQIELALMGLGPDAHTASLFGGKPELEETERLATAVPEAGMEPQVPRVTLTLPVFNAMAGSVVFLVAGEDKAEALERAFGESPDPDAPSARVRPRPPGELAVLADRAAAARLA